MTYRIHRGSFWLTFAMISSIALFDFILNPQKNVQSYGKSQEQSICRIIARRNIVSSKYGLMITFQ
ncbi:MAG TPA: hypothetical protein DD473_15355 [Planctomycetaceae bacterium]|nr:hypothetical protein [Planctomycetaceae bacterium]